MKLIKGYRKINFDYFPLDKGVKMRIYVHTLENHDYSTMQNKLSFDEKERAAKFLNQGDAHAYIVKEAVKRRSLEIITGVPAENFIFKKGEFGKPKIAEKINFNTSRAKGAIVVGISSEAIGVDIAYLDPAIQLKDYAEVALTSFERATIDNPKQLIIHWALKESFLKFIGKGLHIEPSEIGFEIVNESTIKFISEHQDLAKNQCNYCLIELEGKWVISICFKENCTKLDLNFLNKQPGIQLISNTSEAEPRFFYQPLFQFLF